MLENMFLPLLPAIRALNPPPSLVSSASLIASIASITPQQPCQDTMRRDLAERLIVKLPGKNLSMVPVPVVTVTQDLRAQNVTEALLRERDRCFGNPVTLIRGLPQAIGFDMEAFSSATLAAEHGDVEVELRVQRQQEPDSNTHNGQEVWFCTSTSKKSNIAAYADYQAAFLAEQDVTVRRRPQKKVTVDFCTNIDLIDEESWRRQYAELQKLPVFLQVNSPEDMLYQYDQAILGMNRAQMYMKVAGCRTPGHQENNNFCSVNLNLGPGDCEWFAVEPKYWTDINELCKANGVDFLKGSWWPSLPDLQRGEIPYTRFVQKMGEVVHLNAGTVHWVQAVDVCNNVAWNVGPLTANQFAQALERYTCNIPERYKSIVPMETLAWRLTNVQSADAEFHRALHAHLKASLEAQHALDRRVMTRRLRIIECAPEGAAIYCVDCQAEIFNYIFVRDKEDAEQPTYCEKCASKVLRGKPQVVFRKRSVTELMQALNDYEEFLSQMEPPK